MFENFKNSIDFYLRNKIKFSRKNFIEKNKKLIERNIQENLYTEDILSQAFQKIDKTDVQILDIGTKNWFYAKGEHNFFNKLYENFSIDGIELDAYRIYSNFYNRLEVAKYHTKNLENMNYIAGNLLDINKKYDYIIWFLPFVKPKAHMLWGLPLKYFYPEKLFLHAYNLLQKNGQMLIVNQGKEEACVQEKMLNSFNIKYEKLNELNSVHFKYQNTRFGFLVKK